MKEINEKTDIMILKNTQEDILHLSIEERSTNKLIGYVILAGITNPNHNIEFRRIVISDKGHGFGRETLKLVKKLPLSS